jgi:hypothetical protein
MLHNELVKKLETSNEKFLNWLENNGFNSYDQFDFWGSKVGVLSKKLFLKNKWAAAPLVILIQCLESFLPGTRAFFAEKRRFAIGDAHFALGYLNMYRYYKDEKYLGMARELLEYLMTYKTETPHGIGWGYPYTWATGRAVYPPGTPLITVTPYCFYAMHEMYKITGEKKYLEDMKRIAGFAANDLYEAEITDTEVAAGYGLGDKSRIINANTYRAALLLKASELFGIDEYKEKAGKNINFVLGQQKNNGSWAYAVNEAFIDNFHTCFVLKNLYKSYLILKDERILEAVKRGYEYYRKYHFRSDNTPIHFSKISNPKFRKIEMYDYAEGILLGPLLDTDIEGAGDFSAQMARKVVEKFQLKKGYYITRVTTLNTRNKVPYLRWPQAQLFYALTSLQLALTGRD